MRGSTCGSPGHIRRIQQQCLVSYRAACMHGSWPRRAAVLHHQGPASSMAKRVVGQTSHLLGSQSAAGRSAGSACTRPLMDQSLSSPCFHAPRTHASTRASTPSPLLPLAGAGATLAGSATLLGLDALSMRWQTLAVVAIAKAASAFSPLPRPPLSPPRPPATFSLEGPRASPPLPLRRLGGDVCLLARRLPLLPAVANSSISNSRSSSSSCCCATISVLDGAAAGAFLSLVGHASSQCCRTRKTNRRA